MQMAAVIAAEACGALTGEQERAVARRGEPLLVSAGAGSGKTAVLVERFVRAVREDAIAPARILAITFTDRAAGELRERVRARLLELGEREAARDTEAAFVSTFHGFCTRLLRSHALLARLDPHFRILDEALAARLRQRAFALALAEFVAGERAPAVDLVAAYGADRLRAMVWRAFAELRSRGERQPRLPVPTGVDTGADADVEAARACALIDELLERSGRCYETLKRARGAVDFDDLELCALELLRARHGLRAAWAERFELIMVDEFQDTNPRQMAIVSALERGNLFTVGDELQSIYGFRDADVRLFRARRAELARRGASLELTRNFRSDGRLLDVINTAFEARLGPAYTPLVAGREPGRSRADAQQPAVELLLTSKRGWNGGGDEGNGAGRGWGAPRWREAEARALAERVAEMVRAGEAAPGEVVVLLRALGDVETYERALAQAGLHTLATVGGFWARQEVNDLLTYLRALANPLDELALYGTLAGPLAGLSSDGLALLARAAHERGEDAWTTLRGGLAPLRERLEPSELDRLARFCERFARERLIVPARSVSRLLERALSRDGYEAHVRALDSAERRMANVHKLLRLARRFEAGEGRDLRAFLDHVAHQEALAAAPEADAPVAGAEPDAVRLMSIHAAKGLEFPVVCVADLGRALNLGVGDLLVDGPRVGLRLARLDGAEAAPALEFAALSEERQRAQAEEEERILYVAMTRARERLLLSAAVTFERWPDPRRGAPTIAWLGPALVPELPERARAFAEQGGTARFDACAGGRAEARTLVRLIGAEPPPASSPFARAPAPLSAPAGSDQGGVPDSPASRVPPREPTQALAEDVGSLSYTALAELRRCAYRFYLERVLGLEERRGGVRGRRARDGLDARARGAVVHRLLESARFGSPSAPTAGEAAAAARELGLQAGRRECEEMARLAGVVTREASAGGPAARLAAAAEVRREHPFAFSLAQGEPLFTGVIDVLAREPDGGALVVDYKTDRVPAEARLEQLVQRDYGLQRLIYALAVLRAGAPSVEIVHWFLERAQEWVSARYEASARARLEDQLAQELRRARERGYAVSENPHRALCETCPGRAGLCSYGDAETMREGPGGGALEAVL